MRMQGLVQGLKEWMLGIRVESRKQIIQFTLGGTLMVLALIAVAELAISYWLGSVFWHDLARGMSVGILIAPPAFLFNAVVLYRNSVLARRFKAALRMANRNADALAEKNEELEIAQLRLDELANSDFLTGLANRRRFEEALVRAYGAAENGQAHFALILLDLDAFKPVNDTYGHDAGDAVLRHTGVRIRKALSEREGLAARLGGDEFAVLLWDVLDGNDLARFASGLETALAEPQAYKGDMLSVTATIGAALYSDTFTSASDMYITTDRRLIALKERKRCAPVRVAESPLRTSAG